MYLAVEQKQSAPGLVLALHRPLLGKTILLQACSGTCVLHLVGKLICRRVDVADWLAEICTIHVY